MAGMLYLVPTPIGNLGDISPRAAKTLELADFIAAEDTRVSVRILNHLALKKPMISYYEHNKNEVGPKIVGRLLAGEICALVSDAGTPAISDPGEDLVRLCAQSGVDVCSIPGPCALVTALTLSGFATERFTFEGFLSMNKRSRKEHIASLTQESRTMIFYEAPHKLMATLDDFQNAFGGQRRIALCRELTKLHEEVLRMRIDEAISHCQQQAPRGEYVLVLEGAAPIAAEEISLEAALLLVAEQIQGGLSRKDAVRQIAKETGLAKNVLYDAALRQVK